MDVEKLTNKLEKAQLVIGDIKNTTRNFYRKYNPAPIGCIFFDLDYYSSTLDGFNILMLVKKIFFLELTYILMMY